MALEPAGYSPAMTKLEVHLLSQHAKTYSAYYNGKMSYTLHGKGWQKFVESAFDGLGGQETSENIFKDTIDLYSTSLMPVQDELSGFTNTVVPLLARGEAPIVHMNDGTTSFPEHYEIMSDGKYTVTVIFTRSLRDMMDYATFVSGYGEEGDATARLFGKAIPEDFAKADREGYKFIEETSGHTLYRLNLDDRGMGGSLAALQDRANHSIIDQTVIAEMYARPFWYLLNVELPPDNPYLPKGSNPQNEAIREHKNQTGAAQLFTTSGEGPFGQLQPPTIGDMVAYHDSIISKVSQSTGIPEFYFKPGGNVPSGVALKVLSQRFNNKISRIRENIKDDLTRLAVQMGLTPEEGQDEVELWSGSNDLLQEALDAHGEALFRMGYPLEYIAEVVTPGIDLDEYLDDGFNEGQVPTADQVAAYASNGPLTPPATE